MRRWFIGGAIGATLALAGNEFVEWRESADTLARVAAIQAQPAENWLAIEISIDDVGPGQDPMVRARFSVLRPVIIRTNISPRNVETGESICEGRITSAYDQPDGPRDLMIPVATLAGLESCDWPAGRYVASITFTMTDLETNVQIKQIVHEDEFTVSR